MSASETTQSDASSPGGSGGSRARRDVQEIRLYELALAQSWKVPGPVRDRVVARLTEVIDDKDASPREISSASRGLMSATGQTLAAIDTALRARAQTELAERLSELEAWQAAQAGAPGQKPSVVYDHDHDKPSGEALE